MVLRERKREGKKEERERERKRGKRKNGCRRRVDMAGLSKV